MSKITVGASFSGAERDVRLDLLPGRVHVFRETGDLEDGFLVPRGRHDVGVRLLLNALDRRALRTHDKADHSVRHTHLQEATRDHVIGTLTSMKHGGRELDLFSHHKYDPSRLSITTQI